eukprot:XP_011676628.1 PREDICTED: neurogenic locus notch homolog protein 2 [Strongylocentrotus purpuratus]
MCSDVCEIAQNHCQPFVSRMLTVYGMGVTRNMLELCASLPNTDCIRPEQRLPPSSSGCPGECLNGGQCLDGNCLCPPEFTGELCETESNVDPVFEIIITPDYEGIVYDGVNISIMCEVIASNLLNYPVWTGPNGQQVLPQQPGVSDRIYVDQVSSNTMRLVINNVQATDEGSYFCNVGLQSAPYTLYITVPDCLLEPCLNGGLCEGGQCQCPIGFRGPRCEEPVVVEYNITTLPRPSGEIPIGSDVSFLCQVQGGHTTPVWLHPEGYSIQQRNALSRTFTEATSDNTVRLVFTDIRPEDSGVYLCLLDTSFQEINITVASGPRFNVIITSNFTTPPSPGSDLTFICEMSQPDTSAFPIWYYPDGSPIRTRTGTGTSRVYSENISLSATRLIILDATEADEGIYTCRARPLSATLEVTLIVPSCDPACLNGGSCIGGTCLCPYGYEGDVCEIGIIQEICFLPFCLNGGTCDQATCYCLPGFTGNLCESRIAAEYNVTITTDFERRPLVGDEITIMCKVLSDRLSYPQPAWIGPDGNVVPSLATGASSHVFTEFVGPSTTALHIRGIQASDEGLYTCEVDMTIQTITITIQYYECIPACLNGGTCVEGICICPDEYIGAICLEEVPQPCNLPCQNNGHCYGGRCHCATYFIGEYCQTRVGNNFEITVNTVTFDPPSVGDNMRLSCTYIGESGNLQPTWVNPGGELISRMDQGGSRHLSVEEESSMTTTLVINNIVETDSGIYTCTVGEYDNEFDITIQEAQCVPRCQNNGLCSMGMCMCPEGYGGIACEFQITECDFPCANGGTCSNARCICPSGFEGSFCQNRRFADENFRINITPHVPRLPPVGTDLQLICEVDNPQGFQRPVWVKPNGERVVQGDASHINARAISPTATQLNIHMVERGDSGIYTCVIGSYTNTLTVIFYKMPCIPGCQNGGTCSDGSICLCAPGYTGYQCEHRECMPACINGGSCVNGDCECSPDYEGQFCENLRKPVTIRFTPSINDLPLVGDDLTVVCEIIGMTDLVEPRWMDQLGNPVRLFGIAPNQRVGVQYSSRTATTLVLNNLQARDAGIYTCTLGTLTSYFTITVASQADCSVICHNGGTCVSNRCICPEYFNGLQCEQRVGPDYVITVSPPVDQAPILGNDISYVCQIATSSNYPRPAWTSPGGVAVLPIGQGGSEHLNVQYVSDRESRLLIQDLTPNDNGIYTCYIGTLTNSVVISVEIPDCPGPCQNGGTCAGGTCLCPNGFTGVLCDRPAYTIQIRQVGQANTVIGGSIRMSCEIEGARPTYLQPRWTGPNNQPVTTDPNSRVFSIATSSLANQLVISNLQSADQGTFTCTVGPVIATFSIVVEEARCPIPCQNGGSCVRGSCVCPNGYSGIACGTRDPSDVRIKITPNRQGVSHIGQDLEILCEILGTSIYQNPMWKGPSGQLVPGATAERNNLRVQEVYETPSATRLYISGLSPADKGQYICMVGPVMARFTLMVTAPQCNPQCMNGGTCNNGQCICHPGYTGAICQNQGGFSLSIRQVGSTPPVQGANLRFSCQSSGAGRLQNPVWRDPRGQRITHQQGGSDRVYVEMISPSTTTLVINSISAADAGSYACILGTVTTTLNIHIDARVVQCNPPCQNGATCREGTCICHRGYSGQACERIGQECIRPCQNGGTCLNGICQCIPGYSGIDCRNADIRILPPPTSTLVVGQNTTFVCEISDQLGYFNPTWLGPGGTPDDVRSGNGRYVVERVSDYVSRLHVVRVQQVDTGVYVCTVGMLRASFTLTIEAPECPLPCLNGGTCVAGGCQCHAGYTGRQCQNSDVRIKITPNRQGVSHIGQDLEILCEILGTSIYQNPMWKGPSGQLVPGATAERNNLRVQEVYETPSATRLYISGLSPADKGQYICMVGPVMARFTLMVTGKSYHA